MGKPGSCKSLKENAKALPEVTSSRSLKGTEEEMELEQGPKNVEDEQRRRCVEK